MNQRTTAVGETDTDDLMATLADERRRRALRVLWDADGVVSLTELTDEVTRLERGGDVRPDSERVRTSLYHVHLPKLAELGLVTVAESDERTRVTFTGGPEVKGLLANLFAREGT